MSDVGFGNVRPKGRVGARAGDGRGRPGLNLLYLYVLFHIFRAILNL